MDGPSIGALPPSIQPPSSVNSGSISYPPNGPFMMTLAGPPPVGGYKVTKKKLLLVEKAKEAKEKAAVVAAAKEKIAKQ